MNRIFILFLFMLFSLLGNYFSVPMFFGVDLIVGCVFAFLALYYYGVKAAFTVALIGLSYTYLLWGHPYAIITFAFEILFVGVVSRYYEKTNWMILDIVYWLFIGMPVTYFFYSHLLGMDATQVMLIVFKQPFNSLVNLMMALLVIYFIPFETLLRRNYTIYFRHLVVNLLMAFVILTASGVMIIESHRYIELLQDHKIEVLESEGKRIKNMFTKQQKITETAGEMISDVGEYEGFEAVIKKEDGTVLFSTHADTISAITGEGKRQPINADVSLWFPSMNMPTMLLWKKAVYLYQTDISDDTTLYLTMPNAPIVDSLQVQNTHSIQLILFIGFISVLLSSLIVRSLLRPIEQMKSMSQGLPEKVNAGAAFNWPKSHIAEMNSLSENFDVMAQALDGIVRKLKSTNEGLEERVQERTRELEELNMELEIQKAQLFEMYRDMEKKVNLEVAKNREKDRLMMEQSKQAAMGEMISMIAHQWRQPLSTLSLTISNIEDICETDDQVLKEKMDKYTKKSREIIMHLSETIDDFRNYFRPNKNKVLQKPDELVQISVGMIGKALSNRGILIETDLQDNYPVWIYQNELVQVLLNIIKNSQDVILAREIENGKVCIATEQNEQETIFIIRDNAGGIPEELLSKVFEPYFSTKQDKNGTGLGLYMSKSIIEDHHNGKISVRNTEEGAEFRLVIPSFKEAVSPHPDKG